MDIKRITSSMLTAVMIIGSVPITASNAEEHTDMKAMGVTYRLYSDHAEAIDGNGAKGKLIIPAKLDGSLLRLLQAVHLLILR